MLQQIREHEDRAAKLGRSVAPILLQRARELHEAHELAILNPERFASGTSRTGGEWRSIVERSIRADFASALGVSERAAAQILGESQLLFEDLPVTRGRLEQAEILWEAGQQICRVAATLPQESRAEFDRQAAELAVLMTPSQLRKPLQRLRELLHEAPLAERHEQARQHRSVWLTPEIDGMATLSALLPAHIAVGAFNRLDRMARTLRTQDGETRTLAQLRADAAGDILLDGDIAGTAPESDRVASEPTFVPGVRAEIRITVPVLTLAGNDDAPVELDGHGPIPAELARQLVGTASAFYRVLTDPVTCRIISVGRTMRIPPGDMRRFIQLRDQTCRLPGCTRPATRSEIDHAIEWRNGGETAVDNLLTLCVGHHHVRHGDRWTYALHPDGTAEWTTPTGRTRTTRPPALPGAAPGVRFTNEPPPPS